MTTDKDSAVAAELHKAFQQVAPDLGFNYDAWETLPVLERQLAVRACWQAAQSRRFLAGVLEEVPDLDQVIKTVARETAIRSAMEQSGEPREIVAEMLDSLNSMDQEAVLDLTEGEPTTLRAALERFVDQLRRSIEGDPGSTLGDVEEGLNALLAYPFPEDTYQCEQMEANQVHYPHDHGPDGKPQCPGWTHAQAESR
jgi:DNA mismatch repair ATPase MutS